MTQPKTQKTKKKTLVQPKIKAHGKISKMALTRSTGNKADGGAFPLNIMMCLTPPPAIEEHRLLINDFKCQDTFEKLISETVKPGDVVLDLGTGSGIHSLFAARAGARHVYAVDADGVLEFAKQTAAQNGLSDKITFIQTHFKNLELPEKVDVIISNVGFLVSLNEIAPVAKKFLKPGGRMIPDQLEISLGPVEVADFYENHIQNWQYQKYGLDFSHLKQMAVNHPQYLHLQPEAYVAPAQSAPKISVAPDSSEVFNWKFEYVAQKDSVMHGLGGFYSFLSGGKEYLSTRPPFQLDNQIWNNFLLPISQPVSLKAGDVVTAQVNMIRDTYEQRPVWSWSIQVGEKDLGTYSSFKVT